MRWLSVVGIGEDGVDGLSPAAARTVAAASLVVGGTRHLALAAPLIAGETLAWASPIEATYPRILARRGQATCVLATGDPFHYGIGATLATMVPPDEIACLPQASAFSLMAARLGWALQDCTCVSVHGRALERILPELAPCVRLLVLSWDGSTPGKLAALLCQRGFGPTVMTVGEALGGPFERMRAIPAERFALSDVADLNIIALDLRAERGSAGVSLVPGRPEAAFDHDGQITKWPVRAITLAALAPRVGERLWDIGGGSGSITIEWLLAHRRNSAVTIEPRPDRMARLMANATRWGVASRIDPVEDRAPACLDTLPQPDAVFIGGGLTTPGMLDACRRALPPGGRLVVNAVTLESQALLASALAETGGDLITVQIASAEAVGAFHGLRPAMPVMQWRWIKP